MPERVVVASSNPGKISELIGLLGRRYTVVPRPPELAETIEDGATLEANATKKALEVLAFTGTTALADDTGLFVEALDGRPGVHTARYAGPEADDAANIGRMLSELDGIENRRAEFRTVIAVASIDGEVHLATGVVVGRIALRPAGAGGFGYDPVFIPAEADGRTFAEMTEDEKNRISHRGRALRAMLDQLEARSTRS